MFDNGSTMEALKDIVNGNGKRMENGGQIRKEDIFIGEKLKQEKIEISPAMKKRMMLLAMRRSHFPLNERMSYKEQNDRSEQPESHSVDCIEIFKVLELARIGGAVAKNAEIAALFHDIGKTGPVYADDETQHLVIMLFSFILPNVPKEMTIGEFLQKFLGETDEESDKENSRHRKALDKLNSAKIKECPITADTKVIDFFQAHVEWGIKTLEEETGIPAPIKFIAVNHHAVRYGHEIGIKGFQPSEEEIKGAFWLEIVDYFQAVKRRSRRGDHEKIIDEIREEFAGKLEQPRYNLQKAEFEKILKHLADTYLPLKKETTIL